MARRGNRQHVAGSAASRTPPAAPGVNDQRLLPWRAASGSEQVVRLVVPIVVAVASFGVFLPALNFGFVAWDDDRTFLSHTFFHSFSVANLKWMFTTGFMGHYQPLSWMSAALDYQMYGLDGKGYHRTSLVLHAATAVAFYFLSRRLIVLAMGARPGEGIALSLVAGAAALFFGVHPLRVESAVWVTERRDVLSGVFFVTALNAYFRSVSPGAVSIVRKPWHVIAIMLTLLSLLSKAWGMALPVVMLVLDAWPLRRAPLRRDRASIAAWTQLVLQKVPFFALAALAALMALFAQSEQELGVLPLARHGLVPRTAQVFYGSAFYLLRTLVPRELSPLYEIPVRLNPLARPYLDGMIVTIGVTAAVWIVRRRAPALLTVWVCYLVIVAPVLGVAQSGPQFVADRYSYLSCLGFAVLAGGILFALVRRIGAVSWRGRLVATMLPVPILAVLGVLSWRQTGVWQDTMTLWRHVLAVSPDSWLANDNYGTELINAGKSEEALPYLARAVEINPEFGHAWHQYGIALRNLDRYEEAAEKFQRALPTTPDRGQTLLALAESFRGAGQIDAAVEAYLQAAQISVYAVRAYTNLGWMMQRQRRFNEAIQYYQEALKREPTLYTARKGLEESRRGISGGR
ncbi:MAG: tetratricopeptide repeat protein [Phycisphaerae bacterium]|nr:tetratricopeptide repeat protein [Phycisphaerae bacterium]